jgi:hypothetical protein
MALINDTIPQMMKKLHAILSGQTQYQRAVDVAPKVVEI